jgi:hypothetical protein
MILHLIRQLPSSTLLPREENPIIKPFSPSLFLKYKFLNSSTAQPNRQKKAQRKGKLQYKTNVMRFLSAMQLSPA